MARKQRLASDPNLAKDVYSAEEVAAFCENWLKSEADPRTGYVGNYVNLIKKQRQKASHGFYFGLTSAINILVRVGFGFPSNPSAFHFTPTLNPHPLSLP